MTNQELLSKTVNSFCTQCKSHKNKNNKFLKNLDGISVYIKRCVSKRRALFYNSEPSAEGRENRRFSKTHIIIKGKPSHYITNIWKKLS